LLLVSALAVLAALLTLPLLRLSVEATTVLDYLALVAREVKLRNLW